MPSPAFPPALEVGPERAPPWGPRRRSRLPGSKGDPPSGAGRSAGPGRRRSGGVALAPALKGAAFTGGEAGSALRLPEQPFPLPRGRSVEAEGSGVCASLPSCRANLGPSSSEGRRSLGPAVPRGRSPHDGTAPLGHRPKGRFRFFPCQAQAFAGCGDRSRHTYSQTGASPLPVAPSFLSFSCSEFRAEIAL